MIDSKKLNSYTDTLQWHSRLARRTFRSVLTKKFEDREFEPPLEQSFRDLYFDIYMEWSLRFVRK